MSAGNTAASLGVMLGTVGKMEVTINGETETVIVGGIKMKRIQDAIAAMSHIPNLMPKDGDTPESSPVDVVTLIAQGGITACKLLDALLDKRPVTAGSETWSEELDAEQFLNLFELAFEYNIDFFINRVLPSLSGAMVKLSAALTGKAKIPQTLPESSTP